MKKNNKENEFLNIDVLKNIAMSILEQEIKDNKLDVNYEVLTLQEFQKYREIYGYDENEKDSFYDECNNIVYIILDDNSKNDTIDLFNLIMSCYHEIRHVIQSKFSKASYEGFVNFIDSVNSRNDFDYNISHDGYSFEIGANLYGIEKTKEYMIRNYPSLYELTSEEINLISKIIKSEYMIFDASSRFNMFISNLKKYMNQGLVRWKDQPKKVDIDLIIPDEFSMFLNYDGTLKNISEILNNKNFDSIDKRIIYAIFLSDAFLRKVNFNSLSVEEASILEDSLKYKSEIDKKQLEFKKELYDNKRGLYKYRLNNKNNFSEKFILTKKLYIDLLLYGIRFIIFYKKDRNFFRNIILKKIMKFNIQNCVKSIK